MSAHSYVLRDSFTMLGRDLRRALRFLPMAISGILLPILVMLLFVKVLGGAMSSHAGGVSYIDYVAPAILIMTVCSGTGLTAANISADMTGGIISRFRTMAIFRPAVLVGTVLGSSIRTLISVGLVIGVALLLGFRPPARPIDWLAVIGLIALLTFAIQWLAVAMGLVAKSAAGANAATLPLQFGAFVSSAFVDPASMSPGAAWFARNQPFTPVIDTIRGLLMGTAIGSSGIIAVIWCAAIALTGYLWARAAYNREPS